MFVLELALLAQILAPTLATPDAAVDPTPAATQTKTQTKASKRPAPEPLTYIGEPHRGPVPWVAGEPATRAGKKLLALAETIENTRTDTIYSHRTKVRRKAGIYHFDCSGMINWMLARVSKRALATL